MVFFCPIPQHRTNVVIVVRYWRQSEIDWTNYWEEEEVLILRRVFLIPNCVTSRSSAWATPTPV
jgi:hypothetical protein